MITATVGDALREAERAAAALKALEHSALVDDPVDRPDAATVAAARTEAELAEARVRVAEDRAREAAAGEWRAGLGSIGRDVDRLAAVTAKPGKLERALQDIARAAAAFRVASGEHDGAVARLIGRLSDLGPDPDPEHSLRGAAVITAGRDGIRRGNTEVRLVGRTGADAVRYALSGDLDSAVAVVGQRVHDHTPPEPDAWYKDVIGQFPPMGVWGQPDRNLACMIESKRAVRMTDAEIATYREEIKR